MKAVVSLSHCIEMNASGKNYHFIDFAPELCKTSQSWRNNWEARWPHG